MEGLDQMPLEELLTTLQERVQRIQETAQKVEGEIEAYELFREELEKVDMEASDFHAQASSLFEKMVSTLVSIAPENNELVVMYDQARAVMAKYREVYQNTKLGDRATDFNLQETSVHDRLNRLNREKAVFDSGLSGQVMRRVKKKQYQQITEDIEALQEAYLVIPPELVPQHTNQPDVVVRANEAGQLFVDKVVDHHTWLLAAIDQEIEQNMQRAEELSPAYRTETLWALNSDLVEARQKIAYEVVRVLDDLLHATEGDSFRNYDYAHAELQNKIDLSRESFSNSPGP